MASNVVIPQAKLMMLPKKEAAVQDAPDFATGVSFQQIQDMDKHLVALQIEVHQLKEHLADMDKILVMLYEKAHGPIPKKPKPKKPGERNILV